MKSPLRSAVLAAAALGAAAVSASADVFVLKDGRTVDGKVLKEDGTFVWVKTLEKTEKFAVADVASREEGESPYEAYERLSRAAESNQDSVDAQWQLFVFLRDNAGDDKKLQKERDKALGRVLKLAPDNPDARDANGETRFEGRWVPKADLPRLQAEAERTRLRNHWTLELGVPVEVYRTEHFLLLDNTGEKNLAQRAEALEQGYALLTELTHRESLWKEPSPTITMADHAKYLPVLDKYAKSWGMSDEWMKFARLETGGGVWRQKPLPIQIRFPNRGAEGMWYSTVHMLGHLSIWVIWGNTVPPTWLEEGLGEWVEFEVMGENLATCVGGSGAKVAKGGTTDEPAGKKKKGRKGDREDLDERKERCIQAVQDGTFPGMRKFLKMKIGDYSTAEEGAAYGLVTWLISKEREKFGDLLEALRRGSAKEDEPWQVYGYDLIEDMERDWKTWVLSEW